MGANRALVAKCPTDGFRESLARSARIGPHTPPQVCRANPEPVFGAKAALARKRHHRAAVTSKASSYPSGRSANWIKVKSPAAPDSHARGRGGLEWNSAVVAAVCARQRAIIYGSNNNRTITERGQLCEKFLLLSPSWEHSALVLPPLPPRLLQRLALADTEPAFEFVPMENTALTHALGSFQSVCAPAVGTA